MLLRTTAIFVLTALAVTNVVHCEEVWDKIKQAYNVAYDEVHCGFHKVKETFKHHDHDHGNDPCLNKPSKTTTQRTVNVYGVEPGQTVEPLQPNQPLGNNGGNINPTTQPDQYANQYGWQQ